MANALITNKTLTDIADAIRAKGGATGTMLPSAMAGNIRNISGGGGGELPTENRLAVSFGTDGHAGFGL